MKLAEAKRLMARQVKERQAQAVLVDFLNLALPRGSLVRAVPGGDGKVTTAPGYVSGTGDILLLIRMPGDQHFWIMPVFFETKRPVGGRRSPEQIIEQQTCRAAGVPYEFVRTVEEATAALLHLGVSLRVPK